MDLAGQQLRGKILHILRIYPRISPSMLQVALPNLPVGTWRPVLNSLIQEKIVIVEHVNAQSPYGRYRTYESLRLRATDPAPAEITQ